MAKHSPGPWEVERRYSNGCEIIPRIICEKSKDRECGWIADVIGAPYLGYESTLHNARLIAAAPDMLLICNAMLVLTESIPTPTDTRNAASFNEFKSALQAVIARATGK